MCDMNRIILIDVDSLINELEALADSYVDNNCDDFAIGVHNICRQQGVDAAIEVVRKQKSVDPVKHGHWKFAKDVYISCSVCDATILLFNAENPNYCPHCGAKMDGEAE